MDSVSQIVNVSNASNGIEKGKIFLMQPGDLLVYPDNSLKGYQWGYDTINRTLSDLDFGPPTPVPGQTYQFFVPDTKTIDTSKYLYWVTLENGQNGQNGACKTRVYYNGPYANRRVSTIQFDNNVQLQIIPNPNSGSFVLALKGNIYGQVNASIYNALGHVVFRKNFVKTTAEINEKMDTNHLPAGLYFIELLSSDLKKVITRFVVQH